MLYFAAFKSHYSLFAASGTFFAALEDDLKSYDLRKGTIHFPLTKPVPMKLINRIAKLRAAGRPPRPNSRCWAEEKKGARRHGREAAHLAREMAKRRFWRKRGSRSIGDFPLMWIASCQ